MMEPYAARQEHLRDLYVVKTDDDDQPDQQRPENNDTRCDNHLSSFESSFVNLIYLRHVVVSLPPLVFAHNCGNESIRTEILDKIFQKQFLK